jgi:hypothetical protein
MCPVPALRQESVTTLAYVTVTSRPSVSKMTFTLWGKRMAGAKVLCGQDGRV